jgi:tetratricopeptide (TPR) repeat protein
MTLVDSLATRMASAMNMRGLALADKGVSQLTTASPEAYMYYHLGMQKFLDEFYDEAIVILNKAVALDSTFALAYMRIGMSYIFNGRMQDGVPYFVQAKRFDSHLPVKERNLLDVYAEIWLKQNFDLALAKMKTLVDAYPDDKESKSVYALLLWELVKDTTGAIQLFHDVLQQDPKYQLALRFVVQCYEGIKDYDKAIEYCKQLQQYYPEAPISYRGLAELYFLKDDIDAAISAYNGVLAKYPGDADALQSLSTCAIRKRDFAKADYYAEELRKIYANDPFKMDQYYRIKGNLAIWAGKFRTCTKLGSLAIANALASKDSMRVVQAFHSVSQLYDAIGLKDSAAYYYKKSLPWTSLFQKINYPVGLVAIDREYADELRPILRQALVDFRSRVPAQLLPLCDAVQELFDGLANADTAGIISATEHLIQTGQTSSDSRRGLGENNILFGRYQKGKELLEPLVSGPDQLTWGYSYLYDNYLLGMAEEALGNKEAARKYYQEVLRYWGSPEIEIAPIKDTRARLARLTA